MIVNHKLPLESLLYCAAPMVGQSDLAFRLQTVQNGATLTWTQMYLAPELSSDQYMLESLLKSLEMGSNATKNMARYRASPLHDQSAPQVVQLAGNNVQQLVEAARRVAPYADAIDLNLGCPQRHAEQGHYGAYLLPKQNWPLVAEIVSGMVQAVDVPITTKIRLPVPKEQTAQLAVMLAHAGSSLVTVHPRFASSARRRKGLADLDQVVKVREALQGQGLLRSAEQPHKDTAVVSNGNVQCWQDVVNNLELTGASGVMVGETLLQNPALFRPALRDCEHARLPTAKEMAIEYLDFRDTYDQFESPLKVAKQHLQSILCSIPHTMHNHPDVIAERHRSAASMTRTLNRIQSDSDLGWFRKEHLQK